jgi:stage II sporulation protein E
MAGVFSGMGRVATAGAFLVASGMVALSTKTGGEVYAILIEAFLASAIFLLVPQSAIAGLRRTGLGRLGESDASAQAALRGRLGEVSAALLEVSDTTRFVSERLGKMEAVGMEGLYAQVSGHVCAHCGMKTTCWQFDAGSTKNALGEAAAILRREGVLSRERMPRHLANTCCKPDDLLAELNAQFQAQLGRETVRRKVSRVREVVSEQFASMALMLREMTTELCSATMLEPEKTRRIRTYFEKCGLAVIQTRCYKDAYDHVTVEIAFPAYQRQRLKGPDAAADLSSLLDAEFDLPYLAVHEDDITASFTERAA